MKENLNTTQSKELALIEYKRADWGFVQSLKTCGLTRSLQIYTTNTKYQIMKNTVPAVTQQPATGPWSNVQFPLFICDAHTYAYATLRSYDYQPEDTQYSTGFF